jgi:hypothetical protein
MQRFALHLTLALIGSTGALAVHQAQAAQAGQSAQAGRAAQAGSAAQAGQVAQAAPAAAGRLGVTTEQQKEVEDAVARSHATGLGEPLPAAPEVKDLQTVMVSDAVSHVEVAYVDFAARTFFLSVQNPWTLAQDWYGPLSL